MNPVTYQATITSQVNGRVSYHYMKWILSAFDNGTDRDDSKVREHTRTETIMILGLIKRTSDGCNVNLPIKLVKLNLSIYP